MPCINAPDPVSPFDTMALSYLVLGKVNVTGNGAGTRDIDTNKNPVLLSVCAPGEVVLAVLYWNVIGKKDLNASNVVFNGTPVGGEEIGWCDNTCWPAFPPPSAQPPVDQNIVNKVYLAEVTGLVTGSGGYTFSMPGIKPTIHVSESTSDRPTYPGCHGSQGAALIVVYKDACVFRKILIYDGAKMIAGPTSVPVFGGSTSYSISVPATGFTEKAKIFVSAGDTQTKYSDSFLWNGSPVFPSNGYGSVLNPNKGNLLFFDCTSVEALNLNIATMSSDLDCVCWFLLLYVGDQSCCCDGPNPDAAKDDLSYYTGFIGDIDFSLGGCGLRDIDTNITPAVINVAIPGAVIAAYLYWNSIGQRDFNPSYAIFNETKIGSCLVGWCGNTCWSACDNNTGSYLPNGQQNIINRVYRATVTDLVQASNTLVIPQMVPNPVVATSASDEPHFPGCRGGQGAALVVVYSVPPETKDKDTCCPGQKITLQTLKQVLIYDGCVLLIPTPGSDGGVSSYDVDVSTHYSNKIKIGTAAGDAQTQYSDALLWDGTPLPENIYDSYWNPYAGNLLHVRIDSPLPGSGDCCEEKSHTATAISTVDCYSWFLFVYYGVQTFLKSEMTGGQQMMMFSSKGQRNSC